MGMSASQARLLGLQARQSNLEYQGQQINNERTILSQQCTELYNSLLNMAVPTPPSTSDFTTIEYVGTIGATTYSFDATSVKPGNDGSYIVTVNQQAYGDSLQKNAAVATVNSNASGTMKFKSLATTGTNGEATQISAAELANLYVLASDGVSVRKATVDDVQQVSGSNDSYTLKPGVQYFQQSEQGNLNMNMQGAKAGITVNGHAVFDIANADITEEQKVAYEAAIAQSGIVDPKGNPYQASDFYIYFDDDGKANFVLKSDVNDGNTNATTYSYLANGEYNKPTTYNDVQLTFDPTNGRITSIAIPNYATTTDENGNKVFDYTTVESYTTMEVKSQQKTDELAYQEAYSKYEYEQYEYDKKQQEINAKTEIIQQEDRNLELRLQRLDNERTQITTEIEAVEKVINDNIESSYKTFSG